MDGVGNRQVVTETLLSPEISETLQSYQEVNGLLVLEAENGTMTVGSTHNWTSQTVQSGYAGAAYLRALPDVGQRYETDELVGSPRQSFSVQITSPANYTVWVRGMAPDAAGDSVYIGLNGNFNDSAALTDFTNQWGWSRQTMSDTQASLPLTNSGVYTLNLAMREDGLRIDRLLLVTDTNYIPSGVGPAESTFEVISNTTPAELTSHVIHYNYDDVYRLTDAIYTGDITATYQYSYDSVGNMTAYTETLGTQTSRVMRYFDDANRLQDAFDYDAGTTSYLYDNNGNLTLIIPPDGGNWLHYGFDQRNLMISHTLSVSGTNPQLQAAYAYDGAGNRVQQVDYTGTNPVTTTYVNDIVGLTQVLLADDGAEQIYNLFGLDLIGQDEETNTRYLLADGLGSVRTEMVGETVESVTTYDPYGNLLTQTGNSGTTYGYTGEQYDYATGLLYLRARYYNPALRSFMGRDPWSGDMGRPQSMNGWNYTEDNPINLVDPNGAKAFPDHCRTKNNALGYIDCVRKEYGIQPEGLQKIPLAIDIEYLFNGYVYGVSGCWEGEVPYRTAGYTEGFSVSLAAGTGGFGGLELVYDFATMKSAKFQYDGQSALQDFLGIGVSIYAAEIYGLRSYGSIESDYSGKSKFFYVGLGPQSIFGGLTGGYLSFWGLPDASVGGKGLYVSAVAGATFPVFDVGIEGIATYIIRKETLMPYVVGNKGEPRKANRIALFGNIMLGSGSPVNTYLSYMRHEFSVPFYLMMTSRRALAGARAEALADVFDGVHWESYVTKKEYPWLK